MCYEAAFIDLDGTVYREDELISGARKGVEALRDSNCEIQFLTNAALSSQREYSNKLVDMGIPVDPEEVLTSGIVTAEYLATDCPDCTPFVVGEAALEEELCRVGLDPVAKPTHADTLVVGLDRNFNYDVLTDALRALGKDTRYVVTNPDPIRPGKKGQLPSTGAITGAIKGMTGRDPDIIAGKPSDITAEVASDRLGVELEDAIIVGDRLETDIAMGDDTPLTTVLVLSGIANKDELQKANIRPDIVIDSIGEIGTVL